MNLIRRALSWLIGRVPQQYGGSKLDKFGPQDQQVIMSNRFRSGM